MNIIRLIALTLLASCLSSCMTGPTIYAPVSDVSTIDPVPNSGTHRVLPGETLYSIAWRYGLDYHYLAARNHISPPYSIYTGQIIYLKGQKTWLKKTPVASAPVSAWQWPAQGKIIGRFSEFNKGINIKGMLGDPVYVTAAGRVVYSGSGLRGYGNLIIIEHNNLFMTAYAHNSSVFVKEGDIVKSGQKIAEMGSTGAREMMLHFEIRRNGQPVNPLGYLPAR